MTFTYVRSVLCGPLCTSAVLLATVLLTLGFSASPSVSAEPTQLTILHSNNVTGHLFGCPT